MFSVPSESENRAGRKIVHSIIAQEKRFFHRVLTNNPFYDNVYNLFTNGATKSAGGVLQTGGGCAIIILLYSRPERAEEADVSVAQLDRATAS